MKEQILAQVTESITIQEVEAAIVKFEGMLKYSILNGHKNNAKSELEHLENLYKTVNLLREA